MQKQTLVIPNISCGHCVKAVQNELMMMDGIKNVTGDPESKQIRIEWEPPTTLSAIKNLLEEINYPAG